MLTSLLAGLTILIVGDSHLGTGAAGYLATTLHDNLLRQGAAKVHTLGVCGSNAGDWLKSTPGTCGGQERVGTAQPVMLSTNARTRPIGELIAADKADLVIVVLGDTMAGYDNPSFPRTWVWQQTTQLTKAIAATGAACVWVGPGWGGEGGKYKRTYARVKQVGSFLGNNVAPCNYIDSLKFSSPGQWQTADGQHYTLNGYKAWGDAIAKSLAEQPVVKALKKK